MNGKMWIPLPAMTFVILRWASRTEYLFITMMRHRQWLKRSTLSLFERSIVRGLCDPVVALEVLEVSVCYLNRGHP